LLPHATWACRYECNRLTHSAATICLARRNNLSANHGVTRKKTGHVATCRHRLATGDRLAERRGTLGGGEPATQQLRAQFAKGPQPARFRLCLPAYSPANARIQFRGIEFFSVTAGWGASLTDREKTSGRA
jgi:hypothetical protein